MIVTPYRSVNAALRAAQRLANRTGRKVRVLVTKPYPHKLASKYIRQEFKAGRKGKQAVAIGIARSRRKKGNPKAVKTFEGYTMDFTARRQLAQSEDGSFWSRTQVRDPRYGYKWSKWRQTTASAISGLTDGGPRPWRLPKRNPKGKQVAALSPKLGGAGSVRRSR